MHSPLTHSRKTMQSALPNEAPQPLTTNLLPRTTANSLATMHSLLTDPLTTLD
jgi:hypothetical protein